MATYAYCPVCREVHEALERFGDALVLACPKAERPSWVQAERAMAAWAESDDPMPSELSREIERVAGEPFVPTLSEVVEGLKDGTFDILEREARPGELTLMDVLANGQPTTLPKIREWVPGRRR